MFSLCVCVSVCVVRILIDVLILKVTSGPNPNGLLDTAKFNQTVITVFFFGRLFLLRYLRHDVSTDVYLHVYCTIYTTISTDVLQKDYTRLVDLHHARSINRELNLCRTIQVFILKWHRIQTMKQHHVLLDFIIRLLA